METLDHLRERARRWGRDRFCEKQAGLYFVKRPTVDVAATSDAEPGPIDYHTTAVPLSAPEPFLDLGPFAAEWRVAAVKKKPGNPFPERLGIGRAPNCDVVLRLSFVSKLHAHLVVEEGQPLRLVDLESANGTMVRGRRIAPNTPVDVEVGERIQFGALALVLVDAGRLYDLCTTEAQSG